MMISSNKLYNTVVLCVSLTIISVAFVAVSAYPANIQHKRIVRSIPESFYDSYWASNLEPLSDEHFYLRNAEKRAAAMGVDLPDYILHYKSNPNLATFREKMQKSGK